MSQFSDDPFAAPVHPAAFNDGPPKIYPTSVVTWQLVYVVSMFLLYVAVTVGALVFLMFRDQIAQDPDFDMDATEVLIMGIIYAGLGAVLAILFGVGFFWRRGMGGWIYNLVLIALGMTSCCTWPLTIPLLIFWIRDKDVIVNV